MPLENAILQTLAYSDIFDFPLTRDELHRFLVAPSSKSDIEQCAAKMENISFDDGYYFLTGRDEIVDLRRKRENNSRKTFNRAMFYGSILGGLPFVRMVTLTGSLAMLNLSKNPDMDFMLVAKHGRVWTARVFAILLAKIASVFGDTICPNLIVSERTLDWPSHDLYSARELCQMIPISGYEIYLRLFAANTWTKSLLPNANPISFEMLKASKTLNAGEFFLRGKIGDKFEAWEMKRKIARFSSQIGFGAETVFTADICQGNFHHHRQSTDDIYQDRLSALGLDFTKKQSV